MSPLVAEILDARQKRAETLHDLIFSIADATHGADATALSGTSMMMNETAITAQEPRHGRD